MWAECVLPSLFPFMVITLIFVKTGITEKAALPLKKITGIFHLPPIAAPCFLLSICSGYPAGSRVLSEYRQNGLLSKNDFKKLSYLCSTSGPLFIIGSVGFKMFSNKFLGFKLLFAHIISITLIALVISKFSKKSDTRTDKAAKKDENALYNSFYNAVISVAVAGGFIAFFYCLAQFFADFNILYPVEIILKPLFGESVAEAASLGLIEATTGCRALSALPYTKFTAALAGFLITFGGASILAQQLCYLTGGGVSAIKFIGVKFLQAVLCFFIMLLIA